VPPQSPFSAQEKPLKKTILTFGLISGAISSVMMIATVPFADRIGHSYVLGYATIVPDGGVGARDRRFDHL
jgi:hypothetical protein